MIGGGILNNVKDENIYGRRSTLWGGQAGYYQDAIKKHRPYILESFYYADETTEKLIPYFGDFLLDSGAFTFIQNSKAHINWDEYIEKYADFIKRNKVQKYFELDIDSIVGYDQVLKYREKLEKLVGWQSIPVWHRQRGLDEYIRHCKEYSYIAIGGIAIKEIKRNEYPIFHKLLKEAHQRDCKVHGLGFTQLKELPKYKFDSVDSTAWTAGNRFGYLYYFDGSTMRKIHAKKGQRIIKPREAALINYTEWIKYQQYAERFL